MAKFFINRPIVAMVISILMVIVGLVAMVQLPIAQYPNIAPPEILLTATYVGADALTLEQSVATPIEQQMSGVDNMLYMYSTSQTSGSQMQLRVDFDVTTDPSNDQVLTNLRYTQAAVAAARRRRNQGVTVKKSVTSPLALFALYSPKGTYDALFLSNYAYINLNDPMTRVPGVGQVQIFGAGQYAMRLWVNPDTLGKLDITVSEIISALQAQNTVNPAGQVGGEPVPPGQEFTYTVRAQGRLASVEELREHRGAGQARRLAGAGAGRGARRARGADLQPCRAASTGAPARSSPSTSCPARTPSTPCKAATKLMEEAKARFPHDLEYVTALDTTLAVSEGIHEIVKTLFEAMVLVHPRRVHLPAGLPGHADPAAGRAGVAGRHVHGVPAARLLDQHAVALRPRAGHRPRGRRRHRRGRGGRAPHRAGAVAARRRLQGDGGGVGPGGGDRADPGRRVRADGLHPGHHRAHVPAVRGDHRRVGDHLGLQRADA